MHSSISHLVLQIKPVNQFEEACLIEIKLQSNDIMLFGCIYRSPTHTTESDVNNNNLNTLVHHIASDKKYSHICLTGDFNFKINWQLWPTPYPENSKEELFSGNPSWFLSLSTCSWADKTTWYEWTIYTWLDSYRRRVSNHGIEIPSSSWKKWSQCSII